MTNFECFNHTGKLDKPTIDNMKKPRCGNRDLGAEFRHQKETIKQKSKGKRTKRYFLAGKLNFLLNLKN